MKRKITLEFILVVLIAIIIFIIGGYLITKSNMNSITELNLNQYLDIMVIEYEENPSPENIVEKYESIEDYIRITFIESDGLVVADSLAENLENHNNRPEIINLGTTYIRQSDTLNIEMMYLATQLSDGNYLRIAIPTSSILTFLNDFVGLSIIVGALISVISIVLSTALVKEAMKPLKEVKNILRRVNDGVYEEIPTTERQAEINDLLREINDISRLIATDITSLKSETQKTDFLLNHMNQGICVLDNEGLIVLVNQFLRRLYKFNIDINLNKNFRFLFRDNKVQNSIKNAYDNETNTNLVIKIKEEHYSVAINYLEKNWLNKPSVILLFTDITALKNIEILKKDFFDNASHELKSPLTSIIGSSDLIMEGMATDKKTIEDLASRISEEANRMNNLVMDMLTLSKYENQTKLNYRHMIELSIVTNDVINSLSNAASKKQIEIVFDSKDVVYKANYDEMFQVIKNLLENSIKYGIKKGKTGIIIDKNDRYLTIEVNDDGIGIPKEDQSRVFERFFRVDKARSKQTGGTGLGLSIVKHIVINYGGQIELKSAETKGTTVKLFLPLN